MRRLLLLLVSFAMVTGASPAQAESVWDPDDVDSPLDLRWVSARVTSQDEFVLAVSFYSDFRPNKIPRHSTHQHEVFVPLAPFWDGYFARRRDGRIVFTYGDFGSCCNTTVLVHEPKPDVLKVVFATILLEDPYSVSARSAWPTDDGVIRDRTGVIEPS